MAVEAHEVTRRCAQRAERSGAGRGGRGARGGRSSPGFAVKRGDLGAGVRGWAYERVKMTSGQPVVVVRFSVSYRCFSDVLTADSLRVCKELILATKRVEIYSTLTRKTLYPRPPYEFSRNEDVRGI